MEIQTELKSKVISSYLKKCKDILKGFNLPLSIEINSNKKLIFNLKNFSYQRTQRNFVQLKGINEIDISDREKINEINDQLSNILMDSPSNNIINFKKFKRRYRYKDKLMNIQNVLNIKTGERSTLNFNNKKPCILTFSSLINSSMDKENLMKNLNKIIDKFNCLYVFVKSENSSLEKFEHFLTENNCLFKDIQAFYLEYNQIETDLFELEGIKTCENYLNIIITREGQFYKKLEDNENLEEIVKTFNSGGELDTHQYHGKDHNRELTNIEITKLNQILKEYLNSIKTPVSDSNSILEISIHKQYFQDPFINPYVLYKDVSIVCKIPLKFKSIYQGLEEELCKYGLIDRIKKATIFYDYKTDLKELVNRILDYSKNDNLNISLNDLEFEEFSYIRNGHKKKLFDVRLVRKFNHSGTDLEEMKRYYELSKNIKKISNNSLVFRDVQLAPKLLIGDYFIPITNLGWLEGNVGKITDLKHIHGQISLVLFWSLSNRISKSAFLSLSHIYEQNYKEWFEKVNICCICIDEINTLVEFLGKDISSKNFKHFYQDISYQDEYSFFNEIYGIYGYPSILLLSTEGRIHYTGSPFSLDLESNINTMLATKKEANKDIIFFKESLIDSDSKLLSQVKQKITYHSGNLHENLKYNFKFSFSSSRKFKLDQNLHKIQISLNDINLDISLRKTDYLETFNFLEREIFSNISKEKFNITSECIDIVKILQSSICDKCKKEIVENQLEYYCYFCSIYLCVDCGEAIDLEKKGISKLSHEHNLIYLRNSNKNDDEIDLYKLGKKLCLTEDKAELEKQDHQAACNNCDKMITNKARFICLSCKPGCVIAGGFNDYCSDCIKKISDRNNEEYEKLSMKLKRNDDHDTETHIYLRLYYSYGGYFEY